MVLIGGGVELYPQPAGQLTDLGTNGGGVFTDTAGENQRIQPAQTGRQRAQLAVNAVGE